MSLKVYPQVMDKYIEKKRKKKEKKSNGQVGQGPATVGESFPTFILEAPCLKTTLKNKSSDLRYIM